LLIIILSCSWVIGIYIGSRFGLSPLLFLLAVVPLALVFFLRTYRRRLLLACLVTVIFVGASIYSYSSQHAIDEGHLHVYNDQGIVEIKGIVAGDPDVRNTNTRITVNVSAIKLEDGWHDVTGLTLVYTSRYPEYRYGDVLHLTGKPETPISNGDFDYRGYLEHQGIRTVIYYPRIEVTDTGKG